MDIIGILHEKITSRKCILVMGPDLVAGENEEGFFEQFVAHLSKDDKELATLYNEDGFFNLDKVQDPIKRDSIKSEFGTFFNSLSATKGKLYEQIAQIPFHLIFQVSPDLTLQKVFEKLEIPYQFKSYNAAKNAEEQWGMKGRGSLADDEPALIINLVTYCNPKSGKQEDVILCYEDFISFISYFYSTNRLPTAVLTAIYEATHILFLGYRFDKWYWKIIFDLLNYPEPKLTGQRNKKNKTNLIILGNSGGKSEPSNPAPFPGAGTYLENYQSIFQPTSISEFVESLHKSFADTELRGKKDGQQGGSNVSRMVSKIRNHVRAFEIKQALAALSDLEGMQELDMKDQDAILKLISDYNGKKSFYRDDNRSKIAGAGFNVSLGIPEEEVRNITSMIISLMSDFEDRYN